MQVNRMKIQLLLRSSPSRLNTVEQITLFFVFVVNLLVVVNLLPPDSWEFTELSQGGCIPLSKKDTQNLPGRAPSLWPIPRWTWGWTRALPKDLPTYICLWFTSCEGCPEQFLLPTSLPVSTVFVVLLPLPLPSIWGNQTLGFPHSDAETSQK